MKKKLIFLLFILPVLLFWKTETSRAQTVIREKISLTNQNSLHSFQKTQNHETWWPCSPTMKSNDYYNPFQIVWMYSTFPLNPGRQALRSNISNYNVDTSEYYTFKIISGDGSFHFQRDYFDGYDWISEQITDSIRVKGKELWPKAWDEENEEFVTIYDSIKYVDRDYTPFYVINYYYEYSIHFGGIWDREQEVVYSVTGGTTCYVHTFIKRPTYTLATDNAQDTLLYGLKRTIPIDLEINECKTDSLNFVPRNGGSLNDETDFFISITEGAEFGNLSIDNYDYGDGATVDYNTLSKGLYFITKNGENPDSVSTVKVEITCSDPDITPSTVSSKFFIKHNPNPPPGLLMTFDKNVLMPHDSTRIYLKLVNDEGEIVELPSILNFNVEIAEGKDYGILYSEVIDEYSMGFYDISKDGLWFYSNQEVPLDMVDVEIYAEETSSIIACKTNTGSTIKSTSIKQLKKEAGSFPNSQLSISTEDKLSTKGYIQITDPILLGETKYFGLQVRDDYSAYRIEEIPTNYGEKPEFPANAGRWNWINTGSVWSDNPISLSSSGKSGVYWEKKWYNKSIGTNLDLYAAMIRVIGRYWEEGKEDDYKVTLKAQYDNKTIERDLKVAKPSKLLSKNISTSYNTYRDVDGSEKNLDNICVEEGGKYGILPHIIKGQIFQEAAKENGIFYPSYRYEPFSTQWDKYLPYWSGRFYFKDTLSTDYSDVPNHVNVKYIDYIRKAKTVWGIIKDYSQLINPNNSSQYGKRNTDHTMSYNKKRFKEIQNKYDEFLNSYKENKRLTSIDAADCANARMAKYFKNEWKKGKAETAVAQTRCASSYGLIQLLYTTARDDSRGIKYEKDALPENLNLLSFFSDFIKYEKRLLTKGLTQENNWDSGFETTIKNKILAMWNTAEDYPPTIIANSQMFLPKK
jgi:hypothetical protein